MKGHDRDYYRKRMIQKDLNEMKKQITAPACVAPKLVL